MTLSTTNGLTYAVVLKLLEGLENKGHHLYCDNYYSSPTLFTDLRRLGFGACGTVRLNRRGLPEAIKSQSRMNKGDVQSVTENGLLSMKWMDKRAVTMISTIHEDSMVSTPRRSRFADHGREVVQKPQCVVEYNHNMGGVDLSDQMVTYYSFSHRTVKWWRRVFFHLIDTTTVNAYTLYTESTQSSRKLTHINFRIELAKGLLQQAGVEIEALSGDDSAGQCEVVPPPLRLTGKHFPEKVPSTASGRPGQLECVVCSNKRGRGKVTSTYRCKTCKKALCVVPCFELYHTCTDPTRHIQTIAA